MAKKLHNAITDVFGIQVGHAQDDEALTGCTVVLCEGGAVGGVDQRGGAPGTRETDLLRPLHLVERVHGVVLAGGSVFGLEAATGVVRYLEERGVGLDKQKARIPIVPATILYDLAIGRADVRPDADMGYQACANASSDPPAEGNVGAGAGCTVGNILGKETAMKSGVGSASIAVGNGVVVGALMAVNAFGDIIDSNNGKIVAGVRSVRKEPLKIGSEGYFADTLQVMRTHIGRKALTLATQERTVIGVVATNARLTKEETNKVAQMAQDGLARSVRPAHTLLDGDTIFALATGERQIDVNIVGAFAAEVVAQAILRAVRAAKSAGGIPAI